MQPPVKKLFSLGRVLFPATTALILLAAVSGKATEPARTTAAQLPASANGPLYFEANTDAVGTLSRFIARGQDCTVVLEPTEATLLLGKLTKVQPGTWDRLIPLAREETRVVHMQLQGADRAARMSGIDELRGKANYFIGNNSEAWRTAVPLYSKVQANEVYPGIRVVYYADATAHLEYDFFVQAHADASHISFHIEGADQVRIDAAGNLVLKIGHDEITQHKPVIYQEKAGVRQRVDGGYRLSGDATVGFWIGQYDHNRELVIDPTLSFSTYLGGTKTDIGWGLAVDDGGNIYVAGETLSMGIQGTNLVATNGVVLPKYRGGLKGFGDAFVAKYSSAGTLVFITYLGGKTDDGALGIALDSTGVYVTGFTDSTNFPLMPNDGSALKSTITNGNNRNPFRIFPVDAFVTKLDTNGATIIYSTYLGGTKREAGYGIAVDGSQHAYVTGLTESTNFFPILSAAQPDSGGGSDAFVVKLETDGLSALYGTYLGGTNLDIGQSIAVNTGDGTAWVTGYTTSTNFPTQNPIVLTRGTNVITYTNLNTQVKPTTALDAFVAQLSASGAALLFSSYLGGSNDDAGLHIAVDSAGAAYVTGATFCKDFPTTVTLGPTLSPSNFTAHVFVTKIDPAGASVPYSVQFGGSQRDEGTAIAVDATGQAYVAGWTSSTNFPIADNANTFFSSTNMNVRKSKGTNDVFVTKLDNTGTGFLFSTYLGGSGSDRANGVAIDQNSPPSIYVVGETTSANFPLTTNNAPQPKLGGAKNSKASDAFVERIDFP